LLSKQDKWADYGQPTTQLVVETRSLVSTDPRRFVETHEVHKPASIGGQRDQIMRAVRETHPDAELASMDEGIATFFTRTLMVVASYEDQASRARIESEFDANSMHGNVSL
jgi:hypothetical protein